MIPYLLAERESMGEYHATVRLEGNDAVVRLGTEKSAAFSCHRVGADCRCPLLHVVTALGS